MKKICIEYSTNTSILEKCVVCVCFVLSLAKDNFINLNLHLEPSLK